MRLQDWNLMAEKTGVKFFPTFIIVAFLGVAAVVVVPAYKKMADKSPDPRNVVITVDWSPGRRSGEPLRPGGLIKDVVTISWRDGSGIHTKQAYKRSPWVRVINAKKGEKIEVWAEQFQGVRLGCKIVQYNALGSSDEGQGPSEVYCVYVTK
jgi:hypothetical protein